LTALKILTIHLKNLVVKGSPELVEQSPFASDKEVINKVQQQLFNAMELLQAYEEGT
jgi:hypothetical protein